jgi:Trk-type K+ transport system membrane component
MMDPPPALPPAAAPAAPPPIPKRRSQVNEYRLKYAQREHKARSKAAARWLLWLGLIFLVIGIFAGFLTARDAEDALTVLSEHDPDEMLDIPGRPSPAKVSDVIAEVKTEAIRVWVIHGVLAATFLALSFWAKKAPLPAAVTGLSVYLVIQLVNFLDDPTTLLQGMVLKILFIGAMAKTISSAMSERNLMRAVRPSAVAEPEPAPEPAPTP